MSTGQPPADIPPERLFRFLLTTPRPIAPVVWRPRGAENVVLYCRALTVLEEAVAADAATGLPPGAWRSRFLCGLVASAVWSGGEPAFSSADGVARLPSTEADALCAEVDATLARISPSYTRTGLAEWMAALKKGAEHGSNFSLLHALAHNDCPSKFFGMPLKDLTDGHWMCFRAAHRVIEARRK